MKKLTNENIVTLEYDNYISDYEFYDTPESGIKFYYNEDLGSHNLDDAIEFILDVYEIDGKSHIFNTTEDVKRAMYKGLEKHEDLNHILQEFSEQFLDIEEGEAYESFDDIIDDNAGYELFEEIENNLDDDTIIELLLNVIDDFTIQRMYGVSQGDWGYALAKSNIDYNYIESVYSGTEFYVATVQYSDETEDSIGGLYIPNSESLFTVLREYFGLEKDEFYLVDNEASHYFDCKKAQVESIINYEYYAVD